MGDKAIVLSTISPIIRIVNDDERILGILSLVLYPPYYSIIFQELSDLNENVLRTELQNSLSPNEMTHTLQCNQIINSNLSEETLNGTDQKNMVFTIKDIENYRFIIPNDKMPSCSYFFQQILVHGIAAPTIDFQSNYTLVFYVNNHYHSVPSIPSHIQLFHPFFTSINEFWNDIVNFYREYIKFLFKSKCLPRDYKYPLTLAASSLLGAKMQSVEQKIKESPRYEIIKLDELESLFDSDGVLINQELFKKRLFYSCCEPGALPYIIPFAAGVYPLNSTFRDRTTINNNMKTDFKKLYDQVSTISKKQIKCHKKLRESLRVINQDADRTDRLTTAFKNPKKPGLFMLTTLLKCYCMYNQKVGYLQGMNDMFVPLIMTFIPSWSDDGDPLDKENQIISEEELLSEYLPMIFFCYVSIIKCTQHIKLLSNVTDRSNQISHIMIAIVTKFEPLVGIWLAQNNLSEFLWMYSDFIYLYKRSISQIWVIWLQMLCFPSPHEWLVYFASAILLGMFHNITLMDDLSMPVMMDTYPKYLSTLVKDLSPIGPKALHLYENYRLTEKEYKLIVSEVYGIVESLNEKEEEEEKPDFESYQFEFCEFDK